MTTIRRKLFVLIAVFFAVALVAAACGDSGEEATPEPPASAPEPPPPAPASTETTASTPETTAPASDDMSGPPYSVEYEWGTFKLSDRIAGKLANEESLNLILSIEGTGIAIFGAAMSDGWQRGIDYEAEEHGYPLAGRVIGPLQTDIPAQVAEIDSLLDADAIDCLAFEAHEPGPYVDIINKAVDSGIPVFGVNADSPDSKRFAFFALDELASGTLAGRMTGQWALDNGVEFEKAGLLTGSVEGPWAQNRMKGFMAGITEVLPDIEFVNGPNTDIESQGWVPADQYASSEAWIIGHPDVDIIFHTDQGVEFVAQVIADQGLHGEMYTSGFNMNPQIADYIRDGIVVVTMVQGFSNQAYNGATACANFLLGGEIYSGHDILDPLAATQENVDSVDWTKPENQ